MGRLIDEDILIDSIPDLSVFEQEDFGTPDMIRLVEDSPTVEAIPKDQYEARLKSDMVAMLEEIDLQFDKICFYKNMGEWKTVPEIKAEYKAVIREKINVLKEAD